MTLAIQHERALECAHEQVLQLEHDIDTGNPSTMLAFAIHCDLQIDPQRQVVLLETLAGMRDRQFNEAYMILASICLPLAKELMEWRRVLLAEHEPFFTAELAKRRKEAA